MNRARLCLLPILPLWAAASVTGAAAQVRETAPLVLELPASARAAGLGNAYVLASADNDALFYNPGLLDTSRGLGASVAFYGRAALFTLSAAAEWWRGGVGLGVQTLSFSADAPDAGAHALGEAGLSDGGDTNASETVLSAGYARVLFGFRSGIVAKLVEQRLPGERDVTFAADLGIARRFGLVTVGFAAQNVGRQPELEGRDADLPLAFSLGAATQTGPVGPLDVTLSAGGSLRDDDRIAASAGVEIAWWPVSGRTFMARIGFRHVDDDRARPLTLGAGFAGDRIILDYAVQDFEAGEPVHRVGIRWR